MRSPIKYYGGKSCMINIILKNFPSTYDIYVEGFGGGASVMLSKTPTPIEIYNDLGDNVYSLFKVISDKCMFDNLKNRLDITPYSAKLREEYKEKLSEHLSIEDRAYYFFYVNRTSFNGVGGFSRNLIVRRNMSKSVSDYLSSIDRLEEVHNRLSSVIIDKKDIFDLICDHDRDGTFMYLDPPYVKSTRKSGTNYEVEMSDEQHTKLVNRLLIFKGKFLLSGYNHEIYNVLTERFGRLDFNANSATECLWKNYKDENNFNIP